MHSEQIRWTLLSNFLTANSILLVAWATIYVADGRPRPWARTCVLVAFASAGLFLSLVWVGIVLRSGKFVKMYIDFGCKVEGQMQPDPGPFTSAEILRSNIKGLAKIARSSRVLLAVPIVFALLYLFLICVSPFAIS